MFSFYATLVHISAPFFFFSAIDYGNLTPNLSVKTFNLNGA